MAKKTPYEVVPQLGKLRDDVLFGDVWEQPELSKRDRSLVTISVLTALYRTDELRGHMKRALDNGVTQDEIRGMITHRLLCRMADGSKCWPNCGGNFRRRLSETMLSQKTPYELVPQLGRLRDEVVYDDVWEQPELSKRDRSLITISALMTLCRRLSCVVICGGHG